MDIQSELKICPTREAAFALLDDLSNPQLQLLAHQLQIVKPRGGRLALIDAIVRNTVGAKLNSQVIRGQ